MLFTECPFAPNMNILIFKNLPDIVEIARHYQLCYHILDINHDRSRLPYILVYYFKCRYVEQLQFKNSYFNR